MQCYAVRTQSILIAGISPGLRSRYFYCLRGVGVSHIIAVNCRLIITFYLILSDRISEHLSSLILRKVFVAVAPLISVLRPGRRLCICDFRSGNSFCFLVQMQCYAVRTQSILIAGISPSLRSCQLYRFRRMRIRQDRQSAFLLRVRQSITIRHFCLFPGVLIQSTIRVLIQSCNCCCPVICLT